MTTQSSFQCERLCIDLPGAPGVRRIIEDLDLEVRRGEFVSILGGSGTGKTTLLRTLAGLTPYSSGRAVYEDARFARQRPAWPWCSRTTGTLC